MKTFAFYGPIRGRAKLPLRLLRRRSSDALPGVMGLLVGLIITWSSLVSAQIQQAWVAKYNNSITNGNHQALKMVLDSSGNIYVLGVSANANTNTGYVVVKYAPNGNQLWAVRYDSTNFPMATPTGFALDSSNNLVVTGSAVTMKYDANGSLLWMAPYNAQAVAVDRGGIPYITGVSGNFTTMKLDSTGSNIWSATWTYQGLANVSQVIAIDSSTNVYVSGPEQASFPLENERDIGIVKYDKNGNQLWEMNKAFGLNGGSRVVGICVDARNNVYVEGDFFPGVGPGAPYVTMKYNASGSGGAIAEDPTADIFSASHSLALDCVGNLIVTGENAYYYPNYSYGTYKLDPNGNYIWTNLFPNIAAGNSQASSIAIDQTNNVYVTGFSSSVGTNGDIDIVTIKYDTDGKQKWLLRYDGPGYGNDAGNAIAVDNFGNVYVAGYETEANGFTSMILVKYSPVVVQQQSNGDFILLANGSPGEEFDIQASTNLQTWQDLGAISADTNGIVSFDDTNAFLFPNRFYYAVPK